LLYKTIGITFNEAELEKVFDYLSAIVLGGDNRFLQFRDFQSRNVMVTPQGLYYIDFQSARIGSGLYDLASLLYQAKANFSNALRNKLLQLYIDELETNRTAGKANILSLFPYMAIFRILQTLGAYGLEGLWNVRLISFKAFLSPCRTLAIYLNLFPIIIYITLTNSNLTFSTFQG
jgi:aminoglycoside/choline kinase family phosphotransferase